MTQQGNHWGRGPTEPIYFLYRRKNASRRAHITLETSPSTKNGARKNRIGCLKIRRNLDPNGRWQSTLDRIFSN